MMNRIAQMRADFPLAAKARDWSERDQADIGVAIKAAIAANDAEALAYWSQYLVRAAGEWRDFCASVRAAEQRMKIDQRREETD
jgi:hypothetical protein